jgi:hypothetical protein
MGKLSQKGGIGGDSNNSTDRFHKGLSDCLLRKTFNRMDRIYRMKRINWNVFCWVLGGGGAPRKKKKKKK